MIPLETELLQDTERWRVPRTDGGPQPLPSRRYRSVEHRASRLGGVTTPVRTPQQLICDFRLLDGGAADDQPAVTDEIALSTAPDRQCRESGFRGSGEPLRDDFPGALDSRRPGIAFGPECGEFLGVGNGPRLHAQPFGLEMECHRLIPCHGPILPRGQASSHVEAGAVLAVPQVRVAPRSIPCS